MLKIVLLCHFFFHIYIQNLDLVLFAELEFKFVPNEVESENMAHMWVEEEKENTQQILANLDREIEQLNRELDQESEDDHLSEKAEQWAGSMFSDGEQDWKDFRQNEGYINNIIKYCFFISSRDFSNPTQHS